MSHGCFHTTIIKVNNCADGTLLLQYAKEHFDFHDHQCLYINMNNFYFQGRGIADFAGEFYHHGGRVLLIDQVFKHPDWSEELRKIYDNYPGLRIVFTGSSVMRLKEAFSKGTEHQGKGRT